MSPKIAFGLFLLGCAFLALGNAERPYPYYNVGQYQDSRTNLRQGDFRNIVVPEAPGAGGTQCFCPCGNGSSGNNENPRDYDELSDDDEYAGGPVHKGNDGGSTANKISAYDKLKPHFGRKQIF